MATRTAGICAALFLLSAPLGALQAVPSPGDAARERAYKLFQEGKTDDAVAAFLEALKANARDIAAHVGLGQAYERLNRPADAAREYGAAVNLNPASAEFRLKLASALADAGSIPAAEDAYRRAVDLAPGQPGPLIALSDLLIRQKRYDDAHAALVRALGYDAANPDTFYGFGRLANEREQWDAAAESFRAAIRLRPGFRAAHLALIAALSSGKRFPDAFAEASMLARLVPDDPDVRSALASALDGLGKHDEAIAEYQAVLKANPGLATVWGNLGWTQYGAGKLADAVVSSRKALEIDPKLAYVRFNLGLIYAAMGDGARSRQEYGEALKAADPSDVKAGTEDVLAALRRSPQSPALRAALELLRKPSGGK